MYTKNSISFTTDPEINFVNASVLVSEGMMMVTISITASAPGYVEFFLEEGTATGEFTIHIFHLKNQNFKVGTISTTLIYQIQ